MPARTSQTVGSFHQAIELTPVNQGPGDAVVSAGSLATANGRVYGGQFLGQSAAAAATTVDSARRLHSMHAYFLLPGDAGREIDYKVTVLRDGRSFSARRVEALQDDRVIYTATFSFQLPSSGVEHQFELPASFPAPDDPELSPLFGLPDPEKPLAEELMDVRLIPGSRWESPVPGQVAAWVRLREDLARDDAGQRAALAFLSDSIVQNPVLARHGLMWDMPGTSMVSLDHALWWHSDVNASDWMLFVQESPNARDGRAVATGRMYTPDGLPIATCAQEMLIRTYS